jgi:hypothetical protein
MSKLPEGGYNKLFRLVMDDDKVVIARILNPNAGPAFKTTASEVATMNFVSWDVRRWGVAEADKIIVLGSHYTGNSRSKGLSWSGKTANPVESEYILMEEAAGTQLSKIWHEMELRDKFKVVDDIVAIEKRLLSTSFTRFVTSH